ncbi:cell-cycle checkpoint protein [Rhodotorula toruloides]|uniref:Cell-cycle checkpoint protein n=1 Tax=Rhodotorula toruloides TaxID=5286 RepID=A0A511KFH7_RHOTO|nr:cell-cycle checkpoint protein [Rhodotorula toruloides]
MASIVDTVLPNPRKRVLAAAAAAARPLKRTKHSLARTAQYAHAGTVGLAGIVKGECARLVTRSPETGAQALVVTRSRPFHIGRSPNNDYIVPHPAVSARHCALYALEADTGEIVVCLEDESTNGTLHNDRKVRRATVVLNDGDKVEIGGQVFRYHHTSRETSARHATASGAAPQLVGDYLVLPRTLGSGAFSQVHLALSTITLKQVACKKLPRRRVSGDRLLVIQREIDMLKSASHPGINKIEAVEVDNEFVVPGGDLFTYLITRTRLDAPEGTPIPPGPSLPSANPLGDFGQARYANQRFTSLQGTLQYMAPEQLLAWTRHEGYDGKKADIWAAGILFALLLTGGHPFEPFLTSSSAASARYGPPAKARADTDALFGRSAIAELARTPADKPVCKNVVKGEMVLPDMHFGSGDANVRALLNSMLHPLASSRCTAHEALQSPWFKSSAAQLEELYRRVVVERTEG